MKSFWKTPLEQCSHLESGNRNKIVLHSDTVYMYVPSSARVQGRDLVPSV